MRLSWAVAVLALVPAAGCASGPERIDVAAAQAAGDTCRQVTMGAGDPETLCGTTEQWAEFDRRAALINAGVTCRWVHTANELCLTEEQWELHARRTQDYADAQRMGVEQASNAAQIGFMNDQAAQSQALFTASQAALQAPAPMQTPGQ